MGHGGFPMGRPSYCDLGFFSKKLPPETIYFGIDSPLREGYYSALFPNSISIRCVSAIEQACEAMRPRRIHFLRMDARRTLFASGFFDEIHLHNVITDPRVPSNDIALFIRETERLLAPEGFFIATCERSHIGEERMAWMHLAAEDSGITPLKIPNLEGATVFHADVSKLCMAQRSFIVVAKKPY